MLLLSDCFFVVIVYFVNNSAWKLLDMPLCNEITSLFLSVGVGGRGQMIFNAV
jgi:hypothetical protein